MSRRHRAGCIKGERGRILRLRLAARDGSRCFYCRTPFPTTAAATLDHYVPWRLWPANHAQNLVLACAPCNQRKADRLPPVFAWLLLAAQTHPTDLARAA